MRRVEGFLWGMAVVILGEAAMATYQWVDIQQMRQERSVLSTLLRDEQRANANNRTLITQLNSRLDATIQVPLIPNKSILESAQQLALRECISQFNKFERQNVWDDAQSECQAKEKK